jgi:hypothetical protein
VAFAFLSVFLWKSILYGAFVWARRALNRPFRRFPARAVTGRLGQPLGWAAPAPAAQAGGGGRAGELPGVSLSCTLVLAAVQAMLFASLFMVRAARGRLSALSVLHRKSFFYGAFVWARRALNGPKTAVPGPGSSARTPARRSSSATSPRTAPPRRWVMTSNLYLLLFIY